MTEVTAPEQHQSSDAILQSLEKIVGKKHLLTQKRKTKRFRKGERTGEGDVLAVVQPGTLLEQWQALETLVLADYIVIMQAANTGLTGGSTPDGDNYDRPIVIVNTRRISGVQLINEGKQVVCLAGSTLDSLEKVLSPLQREPHSVIGSSCIGASVIGGICNNSGGALARRGPAYTELALFARVNEDGSLNLVNHLGIDLGDTTEEILRRLQNGDYTNTNIENDSDRLASVADYEKTIRDIDANTPSRYNADPSTLHEVSGSAGRVCVFAVRMDTFPREDSTVFFIGTNETDDLTNIRRRLLSELERVPIAGEYMHRDAHYISEKYGKDVYLIINFLGTDKVPKAFDIKSRVDAFFELFGWHGATDQILQSIMNLLPSHLPDRIRQFAEKYEHHLLLRVSNDTEEATRSFLGRYFDENKEGSFFECNEEEGRKLFLHRFAAAGAAIRYREAHPRKVEDIVALDIALQRNDRNWFEQLPREMNEKLVRKVYYGHFFCHVFHQDYVLKKGYDSMEFEHKMWDLLDVRGAEYPAEHNVGHMYIAKPELADFYHELDPTNSLNPGIGNTPRYKNWADK